MFGKGNTLWRRVCQKRLLYVTCYRAFLLRTCNVSRIKAMVSLIRCLPTCNRDFMLAIETSHLPRPCNAPVSEGNFQNERRSNAQVKQQLGRHYIPTPQQQPRSGVQPSLTLPVHPAKKARFLTAIGRTNPPTQPHQQQHLSTGSHNNTQTPEKVKAHS
jgi:hypothetical protein